ncbi:uncharacterized protein PV06_03661 [Exophiala oligosperma]|uniref:A to I editase domain-containing protein n=1 Tax=Exophiala oligosperma TaxID=215243 RepID=A0A0D2DS28_9EURO|nr:uncharacterized protein PV06_03661 [Exophiala oligosperma]KIW45260.1 hypothetical protein PV06_03661 [Exophiala oligosperma]
MVSLPQNIANLVLSKFDTLPQKCKPRTQPNGQREWTPMSAIVLAKSGHDPELTCVSLATGTKCLPSSAMTKCKGMVLHDSHAEILALRGLNCWLLSEAKAVLSDPTYHSPFLELDVTDPSGADQSLSLFPRPPLKLKPDVSIHFFTTEAPCGDASMEILMKSMGPDDREPWPVEEAALMNLQGRGHFSLLGYVRRKPARADADPSNSKSCTDKLAVKQYTSVLSFPADLFIQRTENAYIRTLTVYRDQYDPTGYQRAFGQAGRLSDVCHLGRLFRVDPLPEDFPQFRYDKTYTDSDSKGKAKVTNISALWIRYSGSSTADVVEVLMNGVKSGFKQWDLRPAKASVVSRCKLWQLACSMLDLIRDEDRLDKVHRDAWANDLCRSLSAETYAAAKSTHLRDDQIKLRHDITVALGNWTKNGGDYSWNCMEVQTSVP